MTRQNSDRAHSDTTAEANKRTPRQSLRTATRYFAQAFVAAQGLQHAAALTTAMYYDPAIGPLLEADRSLEQELMHIPRDPASFSEYRRQAAAEVAKLSTPSANVASQVAA